MASIPTEPIGSIPRPKELLDALTRRAMGQLSAARLEPLFDAAVRDTLRRFEEAGSPVATDGEQRKSSFATYPLEGFPHLAPEGVSIPFKDGHTRRLPKLTKGPFRYARYAARDLEKALAAAKVPLKQAVISASALSLLYPAEGVPGYPRQDFIEDLVSEAEKDIRQCLALGAAVQIDFTEGRLAVKLDPSLGLLKRFVDLNNMVLERFTAAERARIGVHTCPGGDQDSTHSADVDYAALLPELFRLKAGSFYLQLAGEPDHPRVLALLKPYAQGERRLFIGVTDVLSPDLETPEEVRDRVLEAARFIAPERLGTCDDCGFSPFADDASTSRDTAFAKVRARVAGTQLAAERLGARRG